MNKEQLFFLMEKSFAGCVFQSILFSETGDMLVKFFDSGGNFHEQIHHANGTFSTVN